ncbi:DUF2345 domain-containing protein [Methylovorus sp. MP688]|uniref:DUF2345 domain-containing protein n=1 Tax=Methylovorus sp. (strain MP688) TaxID=887061 RepID=UPI0002F1718F|nr:DUF2345 domain-containing protein [Methylovorus sp. MP688]
MSANRSLIASVREAIRLFAYKAGIKLISAQESIDIQALKHSIDMVANLDIRHTAENITFNAKQEIVVNAGGSYTRWSASGIESGTAGSWKVHANQHGMDGPKTLPVVMPEVPRQLHPLERQRH